MQAAVEIGDDLADHVDLDTLPSKRPDLWVDALGRARQIRDRGGAIDAGGDELRIAGKEAQKVDILEHADDLAIALDREAPLVTLRHFEQSGRDEVVGRDLQDRAGGERADRRIERAAVKDRGVHEIGATDDADALLLVAGEERIGFCRVHSGDGVGDRRLARHDDGVMRVDIGHTRPEQRRETRALFLSRRGVEFRRDVEIEERSEAGILGDEPHDDAARREVAKRFFARDESVRAAALHERTTVEGVARPAQRHEVVAVALLDRALHDDEQAFGRRAGTDDRLAGPEIADVEFGLDELQFLRRQSIEGCVSGVKMLRHMAFLPL